MLLMVFTTDIIPDDGVDLPGSKGKYILFQAGYSPIYAVESEYKVNTRLRYPIMRGIVGDNYLYCKLNWLQRQTLYISTRETWFHKHPVAAWAFIVNIIFFIANLVFAVLNFMKL